MKPTDADRRDCVEDDLVGLLLSVSSEEVDSALKAMKKTGRRARWRSGGNAQDGSYGTYGSYRKLF